MTVLCGTCEGRHLIHVSHQQHECRCGVGGGGIGVLTLQVGLDGACGGSHCRVVGIDNIGNEALALLPLHECVQLATEHAVGHNQVAYGGRVADRLGVETVQRVGAAMESGSVVAVEHIHRALFVGTLIVHGDSGLCAYHQLLADGVVAHRRELEARQVAVACHAHCLNDGQRGCRKESVSSVQLLVYRQRIHSPVRLATRRLQGRHHSAVQSDGVVYHTAHLHVETCAQRHLYQRRPCRQIGGSNLRRGYHSLHGQLRECATVNNGLSCLDVTDRKYNL